MNECNGPVCLYIPSGPSGSPGSLQALFRPSRPLDASRSSPPRSPPCQLNRDPAACCLPPSSSIHHTPSLIGQLPHWSLRLMHLTPVCIKANNSTSQLGDL